MASERQDDISGAEQQAEAAAALERETRVGRVVEQLRKRLEQQQAENEQLEDLLRQADASLNGILLSSPPQKIRESVHQLSGVKTLKLCGARRFSMKDPAGAVNAEA